MALVLPTANSASLLTLNGWPASPRGLWAGEQGLGVFGNTVKIVKFASQGWESKRPGSGFPGENHRQIPLRLAGEEAKGGQLVPGGP